MKKFGIIFFFAAAISAMAADTTVKGYLVDISCASDEGQKPDFGIKHTKACLQMDDCANSGYGVLTPDKKVIRFDKAGNDSTKKFLNTMTKHNDIKVTVTGNLNGDQMTVNKIELQ
jgi:predicted RNA-binding protein Jag